MKKTQEILGLPIISISDGLEVGRVKNIIINADKGTVDYIVVDSGIQILSAKIIPTDKVLGIGEYALTIENEEAINELSKIPAAIDLLQKNILVKGTKVLTKKGRLIGEIGDIFVSEDENCKIVGLEYIADITQKKIRIIPRDSVITFGKNLVVVKEDVEETLLEKASDLNEYKDTGKNSKAGEEKTLKGHSSLGDITSNTDKLLVAQGESNKEIEETDMEESLVDELLNMDVMGQGDINDKRQSSKNNKFEFVAEPVTNQDTHTKKDTKKDAESSNHASSLFEQRQKRYLSGRKATKTILNPSGSIIVNEGSIITDELIEIAKNNGKLIELVMNNKA
jgi:uncharacterized protein YrrD